MAERSEEVSGPPVRYCTRCTKPVPPERVARGSVFCGDDCRIADKRERRAWKASRYCRLCGRAAKRPRKPKTESAAGGAVAETADAVATGAQADTAQGGKVDEQLGS